MDPNSIGSVISQASYTVVWSSLVKWILSQLELGRAINIMTFGLIGQQYIDEKNKCFYISLSDSFLKRFGLVFKLELPGQKSLVIGPTVKLNIATIAKDSTLDKNIVTNCISIYFQTIGEILSSSKSVEIDLSPFGILKSTNKAVTYSQPLKKQIASMSKQTVKGLMELISDQSQEKINATSRESNLISNKEEKDSQLAMFKSKTHKKLTDYPSTTLFQSIQASGESPTRRSLKVKNIAIDSTMLGAGADPKEMRHDFAYAGNDIDSLFKTKFKKPPYVDPRFPSVIDLYARTIAAPITSQRHFFPLPHKIGTHYTFTSRGLYISSESGQVRFKVMDDKTAIKLNMMALTYIEPASENEEYIIITKKLEDSGNHLEARKNAYKRYRYYVENMIPDEVVAPINQKWIENIYLKIPSDIHSVPFDLIKEMINSMLNTANKEYYISVKKSIIDYILKNNNERERLGLPVMFHPPNDYGSKPFIGIEPSEEWRNNAVMAAMHMRDNLNIFNNAMLQLIKVWDIYSEMLLIKIPEEMEYFSIADFVTEQANRMAKVKGLLNTEWIHKTADILREESESIDNSQKKNFFESVATLMSNQLRSLIIKSISSYVDYIQQFQKELYPTAEQVLARKYDQDTPIENNFIVLRIGNDNNTIIFTDPLHHVSKELLKIIDDCVKQSQEMPRSENSFARSEKTKLWEVPLEDEVVKQAISKVEKVIEENLNVVEKVLNIYDSYVYLLKEKVKVTKFCETKKDRESYIEEIKKYEEVILKINQELPSFLYMNMFLIDCREINRTLRKCCEDLINQLLKSALTLMIDKTSNLSRDYESIKEKASTKPETEAKLVETETFIDKAKNEQIKKNLEEYEDVLQWLKTIFNTNYRTTDDDLKTIYNTHLNIEQIEKTLDLYEGKLKTARLDFENKLNKKRTELFTTLDEISAELDTFKEMSEERAGGKKNNEEVLAELNEQLKKAHLDIDDLIEKESLMGFTPTDFPKLQTCEETIKPFEQLWNLNKQQNESLKKWKEDNIFELVPDVIEKDTKDMNRLAMNLKAKFEKLYPKPAGLADIISKRLFEFQKKIPIINCFCNPGMRDRHWKRVSDVLGYTINPKETKKTLYGLDNQRIMDYKEKLEEISDQASQEFVNEKNLNTMADKWANVEFETKSWRSTGTYIVSGASVDEAQTLLDEHLVKTQTMKGHPYAKEFEGRIIEWEKWLLSALAIIEKWTKVQKNWLYLEPVFTSEDILQQLPNEGKLFREVDKSWRSMMEKVNLDKKALSVTKIENIKENLDENHQKLENVSKRLKQYLETKRMKFPRFFFLSDEELLEILSETKDPTRVQKYLGKCFDGIDFLEFDSEKKIHAMLSKEKEKVGLEKVIDPVLAKGCVELWLLELEDDMILSIKETIKRTLEDYKVTERKNWVSKWQTQCILCGSQVFWTYEVEEAMKTAGIKGTEEYSNKQRERVK